MSLLHLPQGVGSVLPQPYHQSRRQSYRPEPIPDGLSKIKYLEPGCEACYIMTDTGRMEEMTWNPQWQYEIIVPDTDVTETETDNKYKNNDKKIKKRKIIMSPGWLAILTPGIWEMWEVDRIPRYYVIQDDERGPYSVKLRHPEYREAIPYTINEDEWYDVQELDNGETKRYGLDIEGRKLAGGWVWMKKLGKEYPLFIRTLTMA